MGKSAKRPKKRRLANQCPTPNKVPYHNGIEASRALVRIMGSDPLRGEYRMYRCPGCKKYHLSSKHKE